MRLLGVMAFLASAPFHAVAGHGEKKGQHQ
jgi:hypothetical protein